MTKDSSRGTIKKMQFFKAESYHLYIYCHGIEDPWNLFDHVRLIISREVKDRLPLVLCEESPCDLIDVLSPLSVILQP